MSVGMTDRMTADSIDRKDIAEYLTSTMKVSKTWSFISERTSTQLAYNRHNCRSGAVLVLFFFVPTTSGKIWTQPDPTQYN